VTLNIATIHAYLDVLLQFMGVLEPAIPRSTVGHKPSHFLGLIDGVVDILLLLLHLCIVVLPFFIGRNNSTVPSAKNKTDY